MLGLILCRGLGGAGKGQLDVVTHFDTSQIPFLYSVKNPTMPIYCTLDKL